MSAPLHGASVRLISLSVVTALDARRGEIPTAESAAEYFARAELLDAAGWTANDVAQAAATVGASSFAEAVLLEGVRLEHKRAGEAKLANHPRLLAEATAMHDAMDRMDLLFSSGRLTEREYLGWKKDHLDEDGSVTIETDAEIGALFDVDPQELHAWRTADAE
jgi:hypothetical protein